jgi:hypothetical protein
MESGPLEPPALRCWSHPLYPVWLAGLSVAITFFQRRHLGLGLGGSFVDRSSATAFSARGMWCRSGTSKSFSNFWTWSRYVAKCGSLQQHSPLTCLIMSWESPFTSSYRTPRDRVVFSPKIRASYSAMLLVALNSKCTMYLNYSPAGVRSRAPAPAPCLREKPPK